MQEELYTVQCPFCGESSEVLIDPSVTRQEYIEDCQICCRPIQFHVLLTEDGGDITVSRGT